MTSVENTLRPAYRRYASLNPDARETIDKTIDLLWNASGREQLTVELLSKSPYKKETEDFILRVGDRALSRLWAYDPGMIMGLHRIWLALSCIGRYYQDLLVKLQLDPDPDYHACLPQSEDACDDFQDITRVPTELDEVIKVALAGGDTTRVEILLRFAMMYSNISELIKGPGTRTRRVQEQGSWVNLSLYSTEDRDAIVGAVSAHFDTPPEFIEPGAGNGLFGGWIMGAAAPPSSYAACDIKGPDCPPPVAGHPCVDVSYSDARDFVVAETRRVAKGGAVLVLAWPRDFAVRCLRVYAILRRVFGGTGVLLYVGEGRGGSCADDAFFEELGRSWERTFSMRGGRIEGSRDVVQVWKLRE